MPSEEITDRLRLGKYFWITARLIQSGLWRRGEALGHVLTILVSVKRFWSLNEKNNMSTDSTRTDMLQVKHGETKNVQSRTTWTTEQINSTMCRDVRNGPFLEAPLGAMKRRHRHLLAFLCAWNIAPPIWSILKKSKKLCYRYAGFRFLRFT